MKKLEIIIRPDALRKVRDELSSLGIHGMNYCEVMGFGRQHGHTEVYRGSTVKVDFLPKIRIELVVHDEALDKVIDAVLKTARTGHVGDGKIFVSEVLDAIRIRTGEHGNEAL